MFPSQVAIYNDNRLVGASTSTAVSNFDETSPLFREIAAMAAVRSAQPALRRGRQVVRAYSEQPGLFAFSRTLNGVEVLVALNTSREPVGLNVEVEHGSQHWRALQGACPAQAVAPGVVRLEIAPLDYSVCLSEQP
jgi:glycosidase